MHKQPHSTGVGYFFHQPHPFILLFRRRQVYGIVLWTRQKLITRSGLGEEILGPRVHLSFLGDFAAKISISNVHMSHVSTFHIVVINIRHVWPNAEKAVKIVVVWGRVDGRGCRNRERGGCKDTRGTEGKRAKQVDEVARCLNVRYTE